MTRRRRHPFRWLVEHFGPRGLLLAICAYIWILLGVGAWQEVPVVRPGAFHFWIPSDVRAFLWVSGGLVAAVCSVANIGRRRVGITRHGRQVWLTDWSSLALAGLLISPLVYGFSFLGAWLLSLANWLGLPTGGLIGYPDAWYAGAYMVALVMLPSLGTSFPAPGGPTK